MKYKHDKKFEDGVWQFIVDHSFATNSGGITCKFGFDNKDNLFDRIESRVNGSYSRADEQELISQQEKKEKLLREEKIKRDREIKREVEREIEREFSIKFDKPLRSSPKLKEEFLLTKRTKRKFDL